MPFLNLITDFIYEVSDSITKNGLRTPVLTDLEALDALFLNSAPNFSKTSSILNTGSTLLADSIGLSTSGTRSSLQHTIPDTKLFYPEPYMASPSYIHTDLHFVHILQYQY